MEENAKGVERVIFRSSLFDHCREKAREGRASGGARGTAIYGPFTKSGEHISRDDREKSHPTPSVSHSLG